MAKVLIPRSDSVSAKVIEPSDFESMFSDDIINDYVKSGFTLTAGSGLAVNIAVGKARLKGLFIHNDSASSKSSLTASNTNYIYVTLTRDTNSEAESWDFTSNTTGSTPTDSLFIGTATTNGSSVTAVDMTDVETISTQFMKRINHDYGDGSDGDVTISSAAGVAGSMQYNNLTINATKSLTATSGSTLVIKVRDTLTVSGTIHMDGKASTGSNAGGTGGTGGGSTNTGGQDGTTATELGIRSFGINAVGGSGGAGGHGGDEAVEIQGGDGAAGTGAETNAFVDNRIQSASSVISSLPVAYGGGGGAGGGGGGGGKGSYSGQSGTGGAGGLGGDGGGTLIIIADTITINNGGLISANGEVGADGSAGGAGSGSNVNGGGGGGAGGGGGGGLVILVYKTLTNNGSVTVTGGAGGTGGVVGGGGGANIAAGGNGTAGSAGVFKSLQIT